MVIFVRFKSHHSILLEKRLSLDPKPYNYPKLVSTLAARCCVMICARVDPLPILVIHIPPLRGKSLQWVYKPLLNWVDDHLLFIWKLDCLKLTAKAPENRPRPKRKRSSLQISIFRCKLAVCFRESNGSLDPQHVIWLKQKYFTNLDFPEIAGVPFPLQNATFWGPKTRPEPAKPAKQAPAAARAKFWEPRPWGGGVGSPRLGGVVFFFGKPPKFWKRKIVPP